MIKLYSISVYTTHTHLHIQHIYTYIYTTYTTHIHHIHNTYTPHILLYLLGLTSLHLNSATSKSSSLTCDIGRTGAIGLGHVQCTSISSIYVEVCRRYVATFWPLWQAGRLLYSHNPACRIWTPEVQSGKNKR